MKTLAEITAAHEFAVLEHLEADAEVPVLDGLQAQGDLIIVPAKGDGIKQATAFANGKRTEIPPAGVAVIAPVGSGHEHRLFASAPGTAWWTPLSDGQDIGFLECTEPVYSLHMEHGATGIAPRCGEEAYILRRQREQAEEERLVED